MAKDSAAKSRLAEYVARRDFAKTSEPGGKQSVPSSSTLRFVIQRHDARRLHYDLRLALDGVFKSWAVTRGPSLDPRDKRLAVEVEDHPLDMATPNQSPPAVTWTRSQPAIAGRPALLTKEIDHEQRKENE